MTDNKPRGEVEVMIWWRFSVELKVKGKPAAGILGGIRKGSIVFATLFNAEMIFYCYFVMF
jgi:hypothetical protein